VANIWTDILAWLFITLFAVWFCQAWLTRHIYGLGWLLLADQDRAKTAYQLLLVPGVALHELSHWIMAKLLFVHTGRFSLFEPQTMQHRRVIRLGYVEIAQSDIWRTSLIGLAPLIGGIAVLSALATLIGIDTTGPLQGQQFLTRLPNSILSAFRNPLAWVPMYLIFAVSNTMLPSREDRRPWVLAVMVPGFIFAALYLFRIVPDIPQNFETLLLNLGSKVIALVAMTVALDVGLMVAIWFAEHLVGRLRGKKVEYK
jgi:hypothetical protein